MERVFLLHKLNNPTFGKRLKETHRGKVVFPPEFCYLEQKLQTFFSNMVFFPPKRKTQENINRNWGRTNEDADEEKGWTEEKRTEK